MEITHTFMRVLYVIFDWWWASELIYKAFHVLCKTAHNNSREKKTHRKLWILTTSHAYYKRREEEKIVIIMKPGHSATFRDSRFVFQLLLPAFACSHEKQQDNTNSGLCHLNLYHTKKNWQKFVEGWRHMTWKLVKHFRPERKNTIEDDVDLAHWLLLLFNRFPWIEIEIRTKSMKRMRFWCCL